VIGKLPLKAVLPKHIQRISTTMAEKGLSPKTQALVYGVVKKMFTDAVENQLLLSSPVLRKLKPRVPTKEASNLNPSQARLLLNHVREKPYGLGVWLQLYVGLRVSEVQGLTWEDLDLASGTMVIRRAWVNRTKKMRDYPKGLRQHTKSIPTELLLLLKEKSGQGLVVPSIEEAEGPFSYRWYNLTLRRYCKAAKIPEINTHALRHTASILYLEAGANKEDLQELFAHSGMNVTERYIHNWKSNLSKVASTMNLLTPIDHKSTTSH
jgi:integrase